MWLTPSGTQKRSPDEYIQKIKAMPENYRILERMPLNPDKLPIKFNDLHRQEGATSKTTATKTIIVVDFEVNGLEHTDKVIEIGMLRCTYSNSTGALLSIDELLDMLQDPGEPIREVVSDVTGITDEMVRGRQIDWDKVRRMLQCNPDAVVAHNAKFDRPFFEQKCPNDLPWRCTMQDIPWYDIGHNSRSLGDLLMREGWFFDAHRAYNDCLATAWLLHVVHGSLHFLFEYLIEPTWKIMAWDSYGAKDILKKRGYKWSPDDRCWWTYTKENKYELKYLQSLYPDCGRATEQKVDPRTQYK